MTTPVIVTAPVPTGSAFSGGLVALRRYAPGKADGPAPVESADPFIDPNAIETGLASQFVTTPWCTSAGWMCPMDQPGAEGKASAVREAPAVPKPETPPSPIALGDLELGGSKLGDSKISHPESDDPKLGHSKDGRVTPDPTREPIDMSRHAGPIQPAQAPTSRIARVSHRSSARAVAPRKSPAWIEMPDILKPTTKAW